MEPLQEQLRGPAGTDYLSCAYANSLIPLLCSNWCLLAPQWPSLCSTASASSRLSPRAPVQQRRLSLHPGRTRPTRTRPREAGAGLLGRKTHPRRPVPSVSLWESPACPARSRCITRHLRVIGVTGPFRMLIINNYTDMINNKWHCSLLLNVLSSPAEDLWWSPDRDWRKRLLDGASISWDTKGGLVLWGDRRWDACWHGCPPRLVPTVGLVSFRLKTLNNRIINNMKY